MSESTRLKKLTAALSRQSRDGHYYTKLEPIHSALKAVVEAAEEIAGASGEDINRFVLWNALAALDSELAKSADKADQFDGSERSSNGLEGRG